MHLRLFHSVISWSDSFGTRFMKLFSASEQMFSIDHSWCFPNAVRSIAMVRQCFAQPSWLDCRCTSSLRRQGWVTVWLLPLPETDLAYLFESPIRWVGLARPTMENEHQHAHAACSEELHRSWIPMQRRRGVEHEPEQRSQMFALSGRNFCWWTTTHVHILSTRLLPKPIEEGSKSISAWIYVCGFSTCSPTGLVPCLECT